MTMPGPPASAWTSYAGYKQSLSRNQRKKAAEEKRTWEAYQAFQHPPQGWWTATCSNCKGYYDRLQHCACYAPQAPQTPSRGPQYYVSPQPTRTWQTPNPGNAGYRPSQHDQNYLPVGEHPWRTASGRRQRLASEALKARSLQVEQKKAKETKRSRGKV